MTALSKFVQYETSFGQPVETGEIVVTPISRVLILTLPFVFPVVTSLGFDPVWFGVSIVVMVEIALITPPIGLNVYMIKGALGDTVTLGTVFRGTFWFLAMDVVTLALIIAFPQIVLWLPSLMVNN